MLDTDELRIGPAEPEDLPQLKALLVENGLPLDGVDDHWRTFIVVHEGRRLVGCGGAEAHRFAALLRSIAVASDFRGKGLGRRIVRELLDRLSAHGLREFYLLTTTAEEYFRKRGFTVIDRDQIHPQLMASRELTGACPSTAVCMRLMMHG